jgi:hypothetical protein
MKPIYIYYLQSKSYTYNQDKYFILHDLINLKGIALYGSQHNTFQIFFQSTIAKCYLNSRDLFDINIDRYITSFSLINFNQMVSLINDINNESKYCDSLDVVSLLQLIIAKWDDWY